MKARKNHVFSFFLTATIAVLPLSFASCDSNVENAVENVGNEIENAADEIGDLGK